MRLIAQQNGKALPINGPFELRWRVDIVFGGRRLLKPC
ncbi:hypothetical protein PAMC26510_35510 [Caballeronia sordidicola]|uniref:Uncharacterized protein n=1 Tax=Caballeronia sordidicola TaxID=196367 RepID=A0A242M513_CABSO|nr:hypothetical protein PAMC26510_35510 [Caballeronia sordidicola]